MRRATVGPSWRYAGLLVIALCACGGVVEPRAERPGDRPASSGAASPDTGARNERLQRIAVIHEAGARPRFSPSSDTIVFDRENRDGFFDVYASDLAGKNMRTLTEGKPGVPQRNNGNARYHPSGRVVVFVSEEAQHFGMGIKRLGDSGIGLFSNLRATPPDASAFWTLTNIPIKKSMADKTVAYAVVNPVFSPSGNRLLWTERHAGGGNHNWGSWRIKGAEFAFDGDRSVLRNERVIYTPRKGNYATAMGFLDENRVIFAGNPDGQHEYGMDQYELSLDSGRVRNLTNTPEVWEEGSCVAPNGQIVYMTNIASSYKLDFGKADWASQPLERDYYIMNSDGSGQERLTYFNDAKAPEYLGGRVAVAACDISRDGRYLGGTLVVDTGKGQRAVLRLKVIMAEFRKPLR